MTQRAPQPQTATGTTVHHLPEYAAHGGPPAQGPRIDPQRITADTAAAVALMFDELTERWAVVSGNGEVYVQASDPADLADWMTEYLASLGQMFKDGEL